MSAFALKEARMEQKRPIFLTVFQSLEYGQEKRPTDFSRGLFKSLIHNDISGGVDGTRTRDPRRDRPVF